MNHSAEHAVVSDVFGDQPLRVDAAQRFGFAEEPPRHAVLQRQYACGRADHRGSANSHGCQRLRLDAQNEQILHAQLVRVVRGRHATDAGAAIVNQADAVSLDRLQAMAAGQYGNRMVGCQTRGKPTTDRACADDADVHGRTIPRNVTQSTWVVYSEAALRR